MSLANRLAQIKSAIATAAKASGRTDSDVKLLAVTKSWPALVINEAYALGLRCFGENYLQEALGKIADLEHLKGIEWHFVGHLQSNKIRAMGDRFKLIHSVDRLSLVHELDKRLQSPQEILIEVQFVEEKQKSGAQPMDVPALLEAIQKTKRLRLAGLMLMPPQGLPLDEKRKLFERARQTAGEWQKTYLSDAHHMKELSMGTSDDFVVAIEAGSTIVRLGTVLFGERVK